MENRKMQIIQELMEQLQDEMGYSSDDLGSRLGREKPQVEVMKLDSEEPMDGMDDVAMEGDMPESPEDKLKSRLMKLRA